MVKPTMTDNHTLTICSVNTHNKLLLELNWELTKKLNPKQHFRWIVVENTQVDDGIKFMIHNKKFHIVKGLRRSEGKFLQYGGYHYAAALPRALNEVKTRFVVFIDPDCFIIRHDWIRETIIHMKKLNLSFMGIPYYPTRIAKHRFFPSTTCMFIDLSKVSKSIIDFRTDFWEMGEIYKWTIPQIMRMLIFRSIPTDLDFPSPITYEMLSFVLIRKIISLLAFNNKNFLLLGMTRDVGYRIYQRFVKDNKYKFECLVSSWENPLYNIRKSVCLTDAVKNIIRRFIIPQSLCIYPKDKKYTTNLRFTDFQLQDMRELGWEEYFWQGKPFAFHIQGVTEGHKTVDLPVLSKIISTFNKSIN